MLTWPKASSTPSLARMRLARASSAIRSFSLSGMIEPHLQQLRPSSRPMSRTASVSLRTVAVRDFHDAGARGELVDECIGLGLVRGIEVGVPFVEQIDLRARRVDDFLQRFELPLAGREAKLLVHRFGDNDHLVLVVAFDVDRYDAAGKLECKTVGGRPVVGLFFHF